jgi:hypothetical protein
MTLDRMKLSVQTVRDNIAIMEECEEPDDAGYYLQLEHEKFVLDCIEKQIPKKPISIKRFTGTTTANCSVCNGKVLKVNYCQHCGQALDWSDTE